MITNDKYYCVYLIEKIFLFSNKTYHILPAPAAALAPLPDLKSNNPVAAPKVHPTADLIANASKWLSMPSGSCHVGLTEDDEEGDDDDDGGDDAASPPLLCGGVLGVSDAIVRFVWLLILRLGAVMFWGRPATRPPP